MITIMIMIMIMITITITIMIPRRRGRMCRHRKWDKRMRMRGKKRTNPVVFYSLIICLPK